MRRFLATLLATPLLLALTTVSAHAEPPVIELSRDGVHWAQNISTPLFDPEFRWVPGDSQTASFYVRNGGGSDGDLAVDVLGGDEEDELLDSGDLRVNARGGGGDWQTIADGGDHRLLTALDLADGKAAKITVNVTFDGRSTSPTQLEFASLAFKVTLSKAIGSAGGDVAEEAPHHYSVIGAVDSVVTEVLPDTGAPDVRWALAVAAMLLGCGTALMVDARREKRDV